MAIVKMRDTEMQDLIQSWAFVSGAQEVVLLLLLLGKLNILGSS